ncbi:MAG: phosphodiester glycosidase family protein [Armatimonadetes bacterium]|nr:phosphodiester glycosidase family protein [Armatimonadota bacterium]
MAPTGLSQLEVCPINHCIRGDYPDSLRTGPCRCVVADWEYETKSLFIEAINLDGGGSTALAVHGVVLNRPSGGQERAVASSLLVFGTPGLVFAIPPPTDASLSVIAGRAVIPIGETAHYRLVDFEGETVPNGDVLWVAEGAAWVDQAGVLRPIEEGEVWLRAIARGRQVSITVTVEAEKGP